MEATEQGNTVELIGEREGRNTDHLLELFQNQDDGLVSPRDAEALGRRLAEMGR